MITKEIEIDGIKFRLTLSDQVINQVNNLKSLYATAYEDPESFEQVSSEISNTINQIAENILPPAESQYLDGLIQEIIKVVDSKSAEVEKELKTKDKPAKRKTKKRNKILRFSDQIYNLKSIKNKKI